MKCSGHYIRNPNERLSLLVTMVEAEDLRRDTGVKHISRQRVVSYPIGITILNGHPWSQIFGHNPKPDNVGGGSGSSK